ncbi:general transcription factor 3C polypeptide 1, partial [Elysia marginata]
VNIPDDFYSRKMVSKNGVMGCCDHFDTRKDITELIRGNGQAESVSLQEAFERWGQTLVIVANQRCRDMVLLQTCDNDMFQETYAFLELVARARHDGEITYCRARRGLCNPETKKFASTSNTYARLNTLVSLGLVTKQIFLLTYEKPHWVNQVRIIHLKRFYTRSKANYQTVFQPVAACLSKTPNNAAPFYNVMREVDFKPELFMKAAKRAGRFFSLSNIPRKSYFQGDSAADEETKENEKAFTGSVTENRVKIITLLETFKGLDKLDDLDEDDGLIDDDNEEAASKEDEAAHEGAFVATLKTGSPSVDDSILHQIVSMVYQSGADGILPTTIRRSFSLSRSQMKYIDKELTTLKLVGTVKKFLGKQRAEMWVRPDIAEKRKDKVKAETSLFSETLDEMEASIADTSIANEEPESIISPEEEAELDARLEEIKVICTIDRVETPAPPAENDDPVKAERKQLILNKLKRLKVYASKAQLYQDIVNVEKGKGWKIRVCRKSVKRIVDSLHAERKVEYLNVQLPDKTGVSFSFFYLLHIGNEIRASALKNVNAAPDACMIGDLIINMPFGKTWNLINRPKELQDVFSDFVEDKQLLNVPLLHVPKHVRVEVMSRKRFMPRLMEDLTMLCSMGLLSFGPKQRCINQEFASIFLHKQAMLLDTRRSLPSFLMTKSPDGKSFPVLHYSLDSRDDLAQYWIDLQIISLNTRLGYRKQADIHGNHGSISLSAAAKPVPFEEIKKRSESDWLPGDRRGVAGLDSYLMT